MTPLPMLRPGTIWMRARRPLLSALLLALAAPVQPGAAAQSVSPGSRSDIEQVSALRSQLWNSFAAADGAARRADVMRQLGGLVSSKDAQAAIEATTLVVKFGETRNAVAAFDSVVRRYRDDDRLADMLAGAVSGSVPKWRPRLIALQGGSRSRAVVGTIGYLVAEDDLRSPATRSRALRALADVETRYGDVTTSLLGAGTPPRLGNVAAATRFRAVRLAPGARLPTITVRTLEGRLASGTELRGRVVLLDFWATWCPPCVAAFPKMARLKQRMAPGEFQIVSISADGDPADARRFVQRQKADWTHWYAGPSGRVSRDWANIAYPFYVVVGRDGNIVGTATAVADAERLVARVARKRVAAGRPA